MPENAPGERELWEKVAAMHNKGEKALGPRWSRTLLEDPQQLAFVLSRYKFAAKMACREKHVLELGCGEGIGTAILSEFAASYTGVDNDYAAIAYAQEAWEREKRRFLQASLLQQAYGTFDSIISLDAINRIEPDEERLFLETIRRNLGDDGICVLGTPNVSFATFQAAEDPQSKKNLYDAGRLEAALGTLFHNVFLFGHNDEIVHTGFAPMAQYLIGLACNKRKDEH